MTSVPAATTRAWVPSQLRLRQRAQLQNPLTLNRYLYALGNPATLIDPDGHDGCSINPFDGNSCLSQPLKATWETGQNAVGFTGGFIYQTPGAADRFGRQFVGGLQAIGSTAVQGGQCGLDSSCGIHNAQDAWGTLSANPEAALGSAWSQGADAAKSGLSQLAYAGADMADKFEACKARNDYFCFGQESSELFVNTEGTGLSLIYGGKGLVSATRGLTAAATALPAAARSAAAAFRNLPTRLRALMAGSEPSFPSELTTPWNARTGISVYKGFDGFGKWVYSGITNNVLRRALEHLGRFDIQAIGNDLTWGQARAIEQAMIVIRKGQNAINSISPTHTYYDEAVRWGQWWLKKNGVKPR